MIKGVFNTPCKIHFPCNNFKIFLIKFYPNLEFRTTFISACLLHFQNDWLETNLGSFINQMCQNENTIQNVSTLDTMQAMVAIWPLHIYLNRGDTLSSRIIQPPVSLPLHPIQTGSKKWTYHTSYFSGIMQ